MSKIEQFVYTASPWGKSDPGWMVFQKSSGIDDSTIGAISPYYRYERPDGWDGASAADASSARATRTCSGRMPTVRARS